ncbi:uncharacterized protein LOC110444490, partial [Mizuhopecten yessoensis]|uniref:uncharacterized protein LOC110444490 n=1 Tax=Mizuhopecten yessoensis TaxID=6573 RepID=UPI000B45E8A0
MHIQDGMFMSGSGTTDLFLEEESKPGDGHTRRLRAVENDTEKPWLLFLNVQGNISLITIVTEGGEKEDQLTFSDDTEGCQSELLSADKSTFRRNIEDTSVCFGNRLLKANEEIRLKVTRTKHDGVCEIGAMSEEHFSHMTLSRKGFGYKVVSKYLTQPVLRNNVLHEPTTSQIVVSIPMVESGLPVFMFSGCTLDLCTDNPSRGLSEETSLKETNETTSGVGEQLQQVQKTLASLERKLSQNENNDNEHKTQILDVMKAAQHEAKLQSTSLSELRDQQCEMMTVIKGTRGTVEKTNVHVKTISSKINKGLNRKNTNPRDDRSLEMLSKYISPNYARIQNSLCENEFMDYLLQDGVLTGQQNEDIRKK